VEHSRDKLIKTSYDIRGEANEATKKYIQKVISSLILLILVSLPLSLVSATTSATNNACAGMNVTGMDKQTWSDLGNIMTIDPPYTSGSINANGITNCRHGTQYGFSLPTGSYDEHSRSGGVRILASLLGTVPANR